MTATPMESPPLTKLESPDVAQAALTMVSHALDVQERARVRMRSHAERYAALSLAAIGFYAALMGTRAEAGLTAIHWTGAIALTVLFLLTLLFFGVVHWPRKIRTGPDPTIIMNTAWDQQEYALWTWCGHMETAYCANNRQLRINHRVVTAQMATVVVQVLVFLYFAALILT